LDLPASEPYIDDVITGTHIAGAPVTGVEDHVGPESWSIDAHIADLDALFTRMFERGMRLAPGKCKFGYFSIEHLGYIITGLGKIPQPSKVEAINKMPAPTTVEGVKSFLGMCGFYRDFVQNFSALAEPLSSLTKKRVAFTWGNEQKEAFSKLKAALTSAPLLRRPDYNRQFVVNTDWSVRGIGGVLQQEETAGGPRWVVAYASRINSPAERVLSAYEGELMAVVWLVTKKWYHYLSARRFVVETDHAALTWLLTSSELTPKLARWALKLSELDLEIRHRSGVNNPVADCLSRSPAVHVVGAAEQVGANSTPVLEGIAATAAVLFCSEPAVEAAARLCVLVAATLLDKPAVPMARDIWEDASTLEALRTGGESAAYLVPQERDRVLHRCAHFRWLPLETEPDSSVRGQAGSTDDEGEEVQSGPTRSRAVPPSALPVFASGAHRLST